MSVKLKCYTCEQQIRGASVPYSCECCKVASYCGKRHHQNKATAWKKNERMYPKVLFWQSRDWLLLEQDEEEEGNI